MIRPDCKPRASQVRAKLYTHGDSCQHLSLRGAVLPLGWAEGAAAIGDDTFLSILDLTENSTQANGSPDE